MRRSFLLWLFVAATASAAPLITSITPASGSVPGGTTVTVTGSGFTKDALVLFGTTLATETRFIDASTLQATTPSLLPRTYDVKVNQSNQESILFQAYTVTGDPSEAFEMILFPIYGPPVFGAFDSRFETNVAAASKSGQPVDVYGATDGSCMLLISPVPQFDFLRVPGNGELQFYPPCSPGPARLMYVRKEEANAVTFNARVTDTTRTASSLGTEIPVVRSGRMTNDVIVLANVPIDGRYRLTLRIYALAPTSAEVRIGGRTHEVALQPGNILTPAYAQFTDFPLPVDPGSHSTVRLTIEPAGTVNPITGTIGPGPPIWAFVTVTNNETQQITTITPD